MLTPPPSPAGGGPKAAAEEEDKPPDALEPSERSARLELLLIVEDQKDWKPYSPSASVIHASDYLGASLRYFRPDITVINLCRSYKYLSIGYYCSLLAEARGQRVFPTVKTINDLSRKAIYSLDMGDLDEALNSILTEHEQPLPVLFSMDVFFGQTDYSPLSELAHQIFETFPMPLMRVEFEYRKNWQISAIKVQNLSTLDAHQEDWFANTLESFNHKVWPNEGAPKAYRYHIAILQNPEEALPPSNSAAIEKFIQVGREFGIQLSLIEKKDLPHLAEYDGLFIRETTAINHYTYLFAKRRKAKGWW